MASSAVGLMLFLALMSTMTKAEDRASAVNQDDACLVQVHAAGRRSITDETDLDGDTMPDTLEMTCAEKFKPIVYLEKDEQFGPSSVDEYLTSCRMVQMASCSNWGSLLQINASEIHTAGARDDSSLDGCPAATAIASRSPGCWFKDKDTDLGPATPPGMAKYRFDSKSEYYLRCLNCFGSTNNNMGMNTKPEARGVHGAEALKQVPFIVHVFPDSSVTEKGVQIQYWFFYPFNGPTIGFGTHQGDWEHFSIMANSDCTERVAYKDFAHGSSDKWQTTFSSLEEENGSLVLYSAVNSHATYTTEGKHKGGTAVTKDKTSKGDRWFPDVLVNPGETTCTAEGRKPMPGTEWIDWAGNWGTASAWDGVLTGAWGGAGEACPSGPHFSYNSEGSPQKC